jgi:hypothetical protein
MNMTTRMIHGLSWIVTVCLAVDVAAEPPLVLVVDVNGESRTVLEGEEVTLEGVGQNPTVKIRSTGTRRLIESGVQFDYPAALNFRENHEWGVKHWELCNVFVLDVDFGIDLLVAKSSKFLDTWIEGELAGARFFSEKPIQSQVTRTALRLDNRQFPAVDVRHVSTLCDDEIVIHRRYYDLSNRDSSRILVIDHPDSLDDENRKLLQTFLDSVKVTD